ncbi:hypothetical protein HK105_200097 [Polyrhizophydium stewartii]|uniref:HMG box domain-containing protein n=1 Tax=Polyrhizophydium stewartii TaxID=2732419 RepID=A0ABR4NKI3_9FUNG
MHLQPRSHQQGTGDASPENVPLGHKATAWSVFVRSNSAAFKAAFPNMRWADLMPSVSSTYRSLPAEEKE